jgi:hypothetical protein
VQGLVGKLPGPQSPYVLVQSWSKIPFIPMAKGSSPSPSLYWSLREGGWKKRYPSLDQGCIHLIPVFNMWSHITPNCKGKGKLYFISQKAKEFPNLSTPI